MYASDVLHFMGLEYTLRGDIEFNDSIDISSLDLEYKGGSLTQELFDKAIKDLLAFKEANSYKNLRKAEYPSIEEQLDMMYWDKANGTTMWHDSISAVKNKYPK